MRLSLGSTGCQPVVFGSLPKNSSDITSRKALLYLPASCRQQQAGSLRSPELKLQASCFVIRHSSF